MLSFKVKSEIKIGEVKLMREKRGKKKKNRHNCYLTQENLYALHGNRKILRATLEEGHSSLKPKPMASFGIWWYSLVVYNFCLCPAGNNGVLAQYTYSKVH